MPAAWRVPAMSQLPIASLPGLPTSDQILRSRPQRWHAWSSDSRLSRFWREELFTADLLPMQQQLALLSAALEEAVRVRCAGRTRPAVEEAIQQLDLSVMEHQHFLTTLASGWPALYEFAAYQRLLRGFHEAVRAWQHAVLVGDSREAAHFRHCELLGWRLLGDASLLIDMFAESVRGDGRRLEPAWAQLPGQDGGSGAVAGLLRRLSGWLRRR